MDLSEVMPSFQEQREKGEPVVAVIGSSAAKALCDGMGEDAELLSAPQVSAAAER